MIQRNNLGKLLLLLVMATTLTIGGMQAVMASEDDAPSMPPCHMKKDCMMSKEMIKARDTFLNDTKDLRKNMMVKRFEMRAIMQGTNPDAKQVSVLAGEIFDIKEQLRAKATELGLPGAGCMGPMGGCMGHGPMGMMGHGCNKMKSGGPPMEGMGGHHHGGETL